MAARGNNARKKDKRRRHAGLRKKMSEALAKSTEGHAQPRRPSRTAESPR